MLRHLATLTIETAVTTLTAALVITVPIFFWRNRAVKQKLRIISDKLAANPGVAGVQTEIQHLLKTFPLETSTIGKPRWEIIKLLEEFDTVIEDRRKALLFGAAEDALAEYAETVQPGLPDTLTSTRRLRMLAEQAKLLSDRVIVLEFL